MQLRNILPLLLSLAIWSMTTSSTMTLRGSLDENVLLESVFADFLGGAAAGPPTGADLWVKYVSANNARLSIWNNRQQMKEEAARNSNEHGFATETRWLIDDLVLVDSPTSADWRWMLMEIGGSPLCAPYSCDATLFGLESIGTDGKDVRLHSFDTHNNIVREAIQKLHENPLLLADTPILSFTDLKPTITIDYKYGYDEKYNAFTFFGEGGGKTASGYEIQVTETIGENFVAPRELFYDQSGNLLSGYDTPIVYTFVETKVSNSDLLAAAAQKNQ